MDPEPERCRRTDGKKWRCSRDVVPDQKYCERHMHRGRQRSRKHVEVTEKVTKSNSPKAVNSKKTPKSFKPPDSANNVSKSSPQPPEVLQPIHHPSSNTSTTSSNIYSRNNCKGNVKNDCSARSTTGIKTYSESNESFNMKRSYKNVLSNSESSTVAPGSDVQPEGFLQSGVGHDTSTAALPETPLTETEPQRCRRTDGRKWRCSSDVLPTQKYCVQHIHRGVKKLTTPSNPVTIAFSPPPLAIPTSLNMGSTHGTLMSDDGTSTSESSSDATTITDDENTSDASKYIIRARDSNIQTPF